ncbi:sensor histidine kinase [Streptomyces sp. NPDC004111]|uniref:sensor histidine kinase n=1 Tax=Streptomyces sp. NPDC004111 TaxID=3364690 RepID=UPI0036775AF7
MVGRGRWGSWRAWCCGLSAVLLLGPAILGPPLGLLLAFSALAAVFAVLVPLPVGRITLPVAAFAVAALSVVADVGYRGVPGITLLWMPFEFAALLVLTGRLTRGTYRGAVPFGVAAAVTALVALALPLRFALRNPQSADGGPLLLVLVALVPVAGAVLTGGRLRAGDVRRRRAVLRARREQRLHMARLLHDFVAHELTGMLLEVQAAQATPYEPEEHREFLGRLEESGLRALDQMDRALHTLRAPDPAESAAPGEVPGNVPDVVPGTEPNGVPGERPDGSRPHSSEALPGPAAPQLLVHGLADLPDLVARFSSSGRVPTALDLDGELVGVLRRETDETAYGMVLEALTNVRRHAPGATSVTVSARRDGKARLRMVVTDDGGGPGDTLLAQRRGGGTGLVGMRERFAVLGGELTAGRPETGGWQVTGTLPI